MNAQQFKIELAKSGLTRYQFSEISGIKYQTVTRWLSNDRLPQWLNLWFVGYNAANNTNK